LNEQHVNFIYKRFWAATACLLGWKPFVSLMSEHLDNMLKEGHDNIANGLPIIDIFSLPKSENEFQDKSLEFKLLFETHVDACVRHHLKVIEEHRIKTKKETPQ
jgi:hypothetical protein